MRIKKFDWSDQAKAPFIQAAQKIIKASPYKDVLRVGSGFAINKKGEAKVSIEPIQRKGNRDLWKEIKILDCFVDETGKIRKRDLPGQQTPLCYIGSFVFSLADKGYKY